MTAPLFGFGTSQEDERTEATAFGLPGGRVLAVAGAGDLPLSLLALGAESVTACDLDPAQLRLARLKATLPLVLDRHEALRVLGLAPAGTGERLRSLRRVTAALPAGQRALWEAHLPELARTGVVWAGRYERYVRRLRRLGGPPLRRRATALVTAGSLAEQARVFDERIDGPVLAAVLRTAFHPAVYRGRGLDARGLQHRERGRSLGRQYHGDLRLWCTGTPAAENFWLQWHLLGHPTGPAALPVWLTETGWQALAAREVALGLEHRDVRDALAACPGRYDRLHLSNVSDWMDEQAFHRLLRTAAASLRPPGRIVWRWLHVDRRPPADLGDRLVVDPTLGERLRLVDRFPFYRVVVATTTDARP